MALNKHMAAAVVEIKGDIDLLMRERQTAQTKEEIKRLEAARDTLEDLYGGPEPDTIEVKPGRYMRRGVALFNASVMPEPLRALELAAASGITKAAASKYLRRWRADGWVRKICHGQYIRRVKFPAVVIPAE
jgi:CRP-like cAMP-binding protein